MPPRDERQRREEPVEEGGSFDAAHLIVPREWQKKDARTDRGLLLLLLLLERRVAEVETDERRRIMKAKNRADRTIRVGASATNGHAWWVGKWGKVGWRRKRCWSRRPSAKLC